MIRRPDYSQIDKNKMIYFLASGGRDSSAMILEAFRLGIKGTMTFNHTYYDGSAIPVLRELEEITSYPLKIIRYEGEEKPRDILREAFRAIPDAIADMKDKGRFNKRFFKCCIKLKEQPNTNFIKSMDPEDSILVMGIKGGDGSKNRRLRMLELRRDKTFYRRHKVNDLLYYYPLRDCHNKDITAILAEWDMESIKSSGCAMCPIFLMFPNMRKKDPKTYQRSLAYAKLMKIDIPQRDQTSITDFCKGD